MISAFIGEETERCGIKVNYVKNNVCFFNKALTHVRLHPIDCNTPLIITVINKKILLYYYYLFILHFNLTFKLYISHYMSEDLILSAYLYFFKY